MDVQAAAQLLHVPLTRESDAALDTLTDDREAEKRQSIERSHDMKRQYEFLMSLLPRTGAWQRRRNILRLAFRNRISDQKTVAELLGESESTISKDIAILQSIIEEIDRYYLYLRELLPDDHHRDILIKLIRKQPLEEMLSESHLEWSILKRQIETVKQAFLKVLKEKKRRNPPHGPEPSRLAHRKGRA